MPEPRCPHGYSYSSHFCSTQYPTGHAPLDAAPYFSDEEEARAYAINLPVERRVGMACAVYVRANLAEHADKPTWHFVSVPYPDSR